MSPVMWGCTSTNLDVDQVHLNCGINPFKPAFLRSQVAFASSNYTLCDRVLGKQLATTCWSPQPWSTIITMVSRIRHPAWSRLYVIRAGRRKTRPSQLARGQHPSQAQTAPPPVGSMPQWLAMNLQSGGRSVDLDWLNIVITIVKWWLIK